jgi:hypothetical protein
MAPTTLPKASGNRVKTDRLDAEELAKHLAQSRPNQLGYAKILRASILQRVGRGDDAADLYLGLVGK